MRSGTTALRAIAPQLGVHGEGRDDVRHKGETQRQEDALDNPPIAAHHQHPDEDGGTDDRDRQRHTEQSKPTGDAGEFGERGAAVGDEDDNGGKERPAHPEALADEVHQALAGDRSQAGHHLLGDDQRDEDGQERPEQVVAVLGAGVAVREDAARVVARVGHDDAGTDDGQVAPRPGESPRARTLGGHAAGRRPPRRGGAARCSDGGPSSRAFRRRITVPWRGVARRPASPRPSRRRW